MKQSQNQDCLSKDSSNSQHFNEQKIVDNEATKTKENMDSTLQNLPSLTISDQTSFKQLKNLTQPNFNHTLQGTKSHNNLRLQKSKKRLFNLTHSIKRPLNDKQSYTDWKVYQNKSDLNMLPFPYCVDESYGLKRSPSSPHSLFTSLLKNKSKQPAQDIKQKAAHFPRLYKLKIQNKVQVRPQRSKENKVYRPIFNYEKTPVNEYLNYDLAEEINYELRNVQIIADQNRRIKKAKKQESQIQARQKSKMNKGIKIKRQYVKNYKGLYKNDF